MLNGTPFLNQLTVQHFENKSFDAQKRGLVIKRTEINEVLAVAILNKESNSIKREKWQND